MAMTRHRLLIADTDDVTLQALTSYLTLEGFDCTTARSCAAVRGAIHDGTVEALVVDSQLPEGGGTALCSTLRLLPAQASLPIYVLAGPSTAGAARDAGATGVIVRPFQIAPLAAALRSHFADVPAPEG